MEAECLGLWSKRDNKEHLSTLWCEQIAKTCIYVVLSSAWNTFVYIILFFFTSWVILCYLVTDSVFVWTKKYIELKLLQRKVWKQGTPLNPESSLNNQKPHKETFGKSWWWWSVMMGGVFAFPTFTPTCVLCSEQYLAWSPSSTHRNVEAIITHHWEEDLDFKSWRAVSHGKLTPTS